MANGSKKPPKLPPGAPKALQNFVACTSASVELDSTKLDWVPKGPLGDFAPSPTFTPGSAPNTGTISMGPLDMAASLGPNGELVVDTSGVPGFLGPVKDGVDKWVNRLNDFLKSNDKKLDGFSVSGNTITLTKASVTAATDETAATTPGTMPAQPQPEPEPPSRPPPGHVPEHAEESANGGCAPWMFGVLISAAAALVTAVLLFNGGGGNEIAVGGGGDEVTDGPPADDTPDPEPEEAGENNDPIDSEDPDNDADPEEVDPEDEVVEDQESPYDVTADFYPLDPLTGGTAWDVANEEPLGDSDFDQPVNIDFFLGDQPVNGRTPFMAVLSPFTEGAFEAWIFEEATSEQIGSTTLFPSSSTLNHFGAGAGQGTAVPCGNGLIFLGTLPDDPRNHSSWGIGTYTAAGQGFPGGTTVSAGSFIGDSPQTPTTFEVNRGAGTIRSNQWITSLPVDECINDPEVRDQIVGSSFFSSPGERDEVAPAPPSTREFIQNSDIFTSGVRDLFPRVPDSGDFIAVGIDRSDGRVDCNEGTPSDDPAIVMAGFIAATNPDGFDVLVRFDGPPPMQRLDQFSWATDVNVFTSQSAERSFGAQVHDGERSDGERLPDGTLDPAGAGITILDDGILFNISHDPNDPPAMIIVQIFSLPEEGGQFSCNTIIVPSLDFPMAPSPTAGTCSAGPQVACVDNNRFQVEIVGPDGPLTPVGLDNPFLEGFESGDTSAWAGVVPLCELGGEHAVHATANSLPPEGLDVVVTDTSTGETQSYSLGQSTPAITDTSAFATCP